MIIQRIQLKIMKNFIYSMRKKDLLFGSILIFFYGLIHSLGPGHGKMFLFGLNIKHKKSTLIFLSFLIAYIQGLISFFIIYIIFKNELVMRSYTKYINNISQYLYGISLILLGVFNIINDFFEKNIKTRYSVFLLFIPCSGVLSVLTVVIILGYKKYLLFATLIMSTGIFTTLLIFSLVMDKISFSFKYSKIVNYIFYFLFIVIGGIILL